MRALQWISLTILLSISSSYAGDVDFIEDFLPLTNSVSSGQILKNSQAIPFNFSTGYNNLDYFYYDFAKLRESKCFIAVTKMSSPNETRKQGDTLTVGADAEWNFLHAFKNDHTQTVRLDFNIARNGVSVAGSTITCPSNTSVGVLKSILKEHLHIKSSIEDFEGTPDQNNDNLRLRMQPQHHQSVELKSNRGVS